MYQNYIFDLYGTLVTVHTDEDSPELWRRTALAMSLQGAAYEPEELRRRCRLLEERARGDTWERLRARLGLDADGREEKTGWRLPPQETEASFPEVYRQLYLEKGVTPGGESLNGLGAWFRALSLERLGLYEGAAELLDRLRAAGRSVYLLSNAQRLFTEPEMRLLGIYDKFDGILYSSDAGVRKPSPFFFRELFDRYGLKPCESVMVGNDYYSDVEGAVRFGVDCLYVSTRESTPYSGNLPGRCARIGNIGEAFEGPA